MRCSRPTTRWPWVHCARCARPGGRVPDDVAVVGFDDSPLSRVTDPPLSTVRQPTDEMGRRMADLLMRLIAADDDDAGELDADELRPLLQTELVVRSSS